MENRDARVNVADDDAQANCQMQAIVGCDIDIHCIDGIAYAGFVGYNFVEYDVAQAREVHAKIGCVDARQKLLSANRDLECLKIAAALPTCSIIDCMCIRL